MPKIRLFIYYILVFILLCSQSFRMHTNYPYGHWRSQTFADKAGYFIYLPATFIYDFNPKKLPDDIIKKTGMGFRIDSANNKIITKYFLGVSMMQAPFFLGAHIYAKNSKGNIADGFSEPYQRAIDLAGVFYLVLGLYLLHLSLKLFFSAPSIVVIISLLLTFFGTNLFYYGIMDTGMSHVYSFFLFSCVIYLLTHKSRMPDLKFKILLGIAVSMILVVRPLNVFFLPIILCWDANNFKGVWDRIKEFATIKNILIWGITFLIIYSPQLIYWKYVSGHFLYYSYGNEGFDNILAPRVRHFLFAPENGLFLYSTMCVFMLAGLFVLARTKAFLSATIFLIFIFLVYISSAWWAWNYGCGCGQRNFVEYYSLLIFPLCSLIRYIYSLKWFRYIAFALLLTLAFYNTKITYHYAGCYFHGTWDWSYYNELINLPNWEWKEPQ